MASVKWLTDVIAATQPFQGHWQTSDYGYSDVSTGTPVRRPLAEMRLKPRSHDLASMRHWTRIAPARSSELRWQQRLTWRSSGSASMPANRGAKASHRPNQSEHLAMSDIRLDHADAPRPLYSDGARRGYRSMPSTGGPRCALWYICDRPSLPIEVFVTDPLPEAVVPRSLPSIQVGNSSGPASGDPGRGD
jgi:hypothetical protein